MDHSFTILHNIKEFQTLFYQNFNKVKEGTSFGGIFNESTYDKSNLFKF